MRIVIAGAGSVGTFIAEDLAKAGHEVVIVEVDADRVAEGVRRGEPVGVTWVAADACEVSEFARAGVDKDDVVAAVTGDDEDNLVISLLAKQEFAVPRVVARVNNPKNEWMFTEMWGVDVSVSTPHLLTALVEEAVSVGSLVRLLSFEGGRARLSEATLADTSRRQRAARRRRDLGAHHPRRRRRRRGHPPRVAPGRATAGRPLRGRPAVGPAGATSSRRRGPRRRPWPSRPRRRSCRCGRCRSCRR